MNIPVAAAELAHRERPDLEHRVLDMGADDYMVKSFEAPVHRSRVRAAFRRLERAAA